MEAALAAYGLSLVGLTAIDLKTKTGQWLLAARADLERAKEDVKLGREWTTQRDSELDLEQLTVALALKQRAIHTERRFAERVAEVADREAREALEDAHERAGRGGDRTRRRARAAPALRPGVKVKCARVMRASPTNAK